MHIDTAIFARGALRLFIESLPPEADNEVFATGRWVIHSGIFGSRDDNPTYLFEITIDGDLDWTMEPDNIGFADLLEPQGWIDEMGVWVGTDLSGYFEGA